MKKVFKRLVKAPIENWLYRQWSTAHFCIISNDCFGGEAYKYARKPYNTPFIGIMLMAPCYLSLLNDLKGYLTETLEFSEESKYVEMNDFRVKNHNYPIGRLKEIEIHFLHYSSKTDAFEKWNRRKERMDFDHLRVNFTIGKDYATEEHLAAFEELPMMNKLCIGPVQKKNYEFYFPVPNLACDATVAFKQSLPVVNIKKWLHGEKDYSVGWFQKCIFRMAKSVLTS